MRLIAIEISNFRNITALTLTPNRHFSVFFGHNAQGKTNLLEAISLLSANQTLQPNRSTTELIKIGCQSANLFASSESDGLNYDLALEISAQRKKFLINGKAASTRPATITAVTFVPDELSAPKGSPAERRKMIDQAIAALWPVYPTIRRSYMKHLSAKNLLIRRQRKDMLDLLDVYDTQLATLGAKLIAARQRLLRQLAPYYSRYYQDIFSDISASMIYQCSGLEQPASDVVEELSIQILEALKARRAEDLARKTTSIGPHVDDVLFTLNGASVRQTASHGQLRLCTLAFKLALIRLIFERVNSVPIFVMDEISGELDPIKSSLLFETVRKLEAQVFISTTRPELIPVTQDVSFFEVVNGSLR